MKLLLFLPLLFLVGGCDYDIAEKVVNANPDYYPELSYQQRLYLVRKNLSNNRDPLCGCYTHKPRHRPSHHTSHHCYAARGVLR